MFDPAPATPRAPTVVQGDSTHVLDGDYAFLPPSRAVLLMGIEQMCRALVANQRAALAVNQEAIGDDQAARMQIDADARWELAMQTPIPPERRAANEARRARTETARKIAEEDLKKKDARLVAGRSLLGNLRAFANSQQGLLGLVEVTALLSKGMTRKQAVAAEREKQGQLARDAAKVRKAEPGVEHDLANYIAEVDKIADTPAVTAERRGGVFLPAFPMHAITAPAMGGEPYAFDPRPGYVKDHRDEIIEIGRKAIDEHYAYNVALVLSDGEKRSKLRQIAADVLASERLECAHIWAALEEGEAIDFRPDTDPRAVLGVDGVLPPKKRF